MLEPLLASADCRRAGLVCLREVAQWEATSAMDPGEGRQPCKPFLSRFEPTLREHIGIECTLGGSFASTQMPLVLHLDPVSQSPQVKRKSQSSSRGPWTPWFWTICTKAFILSRRSGAILCTSTNHKLPTG